MTDRPRSLVWKDDRPWRKRVSIAEWFFLVIGLIAVDAYIWVNTSTQLDQAYQDWSFDQTLRGLKPSLRGFVSDEIAWLAGAREKVEKPEPSQPLKAIPEERPPSPEELLGRLRIPRLNVMAMVREGADADTLRRAVGHIPGTALPGRMGNIGLAGHRDTFFRALRNIKKNDNIDFETEQGTFRYVVDSTKIVSPRDVNVLAASGGKTLTLVTCYPFYYVGSAPRRFIVRATEAEPGPRPQSADEARSRSPG